MKRALVNVPHLHIAASVFGRRRRRRLRGCGCQLSKARPQPLLAGWMQVVAVAARD